MSVETFIVCPEHGDLWVQHDAGPGVPVESATSEACQSWVPTPRSGLELRCPRCDRTLLSAFGVMRSDGLLLEHRPVVDGGNP